VAEERKRGERYIGDNRSLAAVASYAPQGNREVQIIFKEANSLADLDERQISDFAEAVVKVLRGYHRMGIDSLNLSTFSAAMGRRLEHYSLNAKIISRPALQPFYKSDAGFLERLHYEADIEIEPEAVALSLRAQFET
jgi:galactose-1-phosphate uridylyltransferase